MLAFLSFYTTVAKIIIQNQTISYFEKKKEKLLWVLMTLCIIKDCKMRSNVKVSRSKYTAENDIL